jgi:hypothetical protein
MPVAGAAIRDLTLAAGGCIRPIQMRRISKATGQTDYQMIPCGSTLDTACPSCAERARGLRAEQCRHGWHLEDEPDLTSKPPDEGQEFWLTARAQAQARRDRAEAAGEKTADLDQLIEALDEEVAGARVRGSVTCHTRASSSECGSRRRSRSTRRRQDTPDLPRRPVSGRTTGKVFTAPGGRTYRPSMFLTLTLDSYGKVRDDGTPADPAAYDYQRAARDAIHFAALFDRLVQNLRRYLGYDVQYFAAVEPQRRLAPHAHIAFRGAITRAALRQVIAATYHQVWWPPTDTVRYDESAAPVWHESAGRYLDPETGELLPTWDQALDAIGLHDQPLHVVRFGPKFDAQGVLGGTEDAGRCVRYLTKYLTKQVAGCHAADTDPERAHAARLAEVLRYEPCSPRCANWLRYGIQPRNPRPGLVPGLCRGKAHRYENLGYAGRRVLVSRKWSGKTLTPTESSEDYRWERVTPGEHDFLPSTHRLMHVLADRTRWRTALAEARARVKDPSLGGRAA